MRNVISAQVVADVEAAAQAVQSVSKPSHNVQTALKVRVDATALMQKG